MNPIVTSTNLNSLQVKPSASSFEKFQYWLARKVVVEKSHFWNTIASIFQRCLPYFIELKTKMEVSANQLQGKTVSKIEIDRQEKAPSSSTSDHQAKSVEPPAVSSSSTVADVDAQPPKSGAESTIVSNQPISESSTPASSTPSGTEKPTEKDIAKIHSAIDRTAFNIDTAASLALSDLLERQKDAAVTDISWPVKTAWNKLSSLWKAPTEKNPLLVMSMEVQQAIEGKGLKENEKNWLEKQKEERDLGNQKKDKGEFDQEASNKFQQSMAQLRFVLNAELPNQELPLHYAIRLGKPEMVKLLLSLGAQLITINDHDIEILKKDRMGNTAWDCAALSGNSEITDILRTSFKSWFQLKLAIGIKNVFPRGVPFSPQVFPIFQQLEDEVKTSIANLLGSSSRAISDPLAISTNDMIRVAAFVTLGALLGAKGGLKALEWQKGYLAIGVNKLIRLAAGGGMVFEGFESTQQITTFIAGVFKLENPFMAYIIMGMLSKQFPILGYFQSALTTAAVASAIIDLSVVAYKNIRKRPGAVIKKLSVTAVNLFTRSTNFFLPYSPEGQAFLKTLNIKNENKLFKAINNSLTNTVNYLLDSRDKLVSKLGPYEIDKNIKLVASVASPQRENYWENLMLLNRMKASVEYCHHDFSTLMQRVYANSAKHSANTAHSKESTDAISALMNLHHALC